MKLSDLRPCDGCRKPIAPTFFKVSVEHHVIDTQAVRNHVGLETILRGSTALAHAFTGDPDDATKVATKTSLLLCTECFCDNVAGVWEAKGKAEEHAEASP